MRVATFAFALMGALFAAGAALAQVAPPKVLIQTSIGGITVELDPTHAPISVQNFLRYVNEHHYDGTIIYRVVPGFVIQAGSYEASGKERPAHESIPLEAANGLSNLRGAIAMARATEPNTATSEFFINLVDNVRLDRAPLDTDGKTGYAVFGHVVSGLDVVDAIAAVPLGGGPGPFAANSPTMPITIMSVTVVN